MAVTARAEVARPLDVERIRGDFPVLSRTANGRPLVWLDNASTSQKPRQVLEAMRVVYEEHNANIHRGVYEFSERTTAAFEEARAKVARFINAPATREIVFVRNATEGLNLVAYAWGRDNVKAGDRIVTTVLEHHSNFVPWQQLAKDAGAQLVVIDVDDEGRLRLDQLRRELERGANVLALTHTSNGLGVVNPVAEIVRWAKSGGATVVVDAAQSAPHTRVLLVELG
jgi:cysteine desulfurase/selenocysteine lyase